MVRGSCSNLACRNLAADWSAERISSFRSLEAVLRSPGDCPWTRCARSADMLDYMLACPADTKAFVLRHKGNTDGLRADDPEGLAGADCRSVACHDSTRICGRAPTRPQSRPPVVLSRAWNSQRPARRRPCTTRSWRIGSSPCGAAAVVEDPAGSSEELKPLHVRPSRPIAGTCAERKRGGTIARLSIGLPFGSLQVDGLPPDILEPPRLRSRRIRGWFLRGRRALGGGRGSDGELDRRQRDVRILGHGA